MIIQIQLVHNPSSTILHYLIPALCRLNKLKLIKPTIFIMKKAIVFYQSKTGTTKNYAQEIGAYLQAKQIDTLCVPVGEYRENLLQDTDYIIMGCWTKGLMVLFQKPDEIWCDFAQKISVPIHTKVALFATFKISTGSMFKNMAKYFGNAGNLSLPNLKSRNGRLSDKDKVILDGFIEN